MIWNEFAKTGAKLQDAFWNHNYNEDGNLTDASFVFDILDKIKMEEGYSLQIIAARNSGIDDISRLVALPEDNDKPSVEMCMDSEFNPELHIIVEPSKEGVFQAQLLKFTTAWIPYFWHGGYSSRTFVFSEEILRSLEKKSSNFNADDFANDERLNPTVELQGENAIITCCYWSDWRGLVRTKFLGQFRDNLLLTVRPEDCEEEEQSSEVLFQYSCGILF